MKNWISYAVGAAVLALLFVPMRLGGNSAVFAAATDGQDIYTAKCASCHKADGKGGGPFPGLAGNKDVTAKDPAAALGIVVHGKGLMPAYKGKLSNAEIAAVMTYIRSSWGNKAPAVTESDVASVK